MRNKLLHSLFIVLAFCLALGAGLLALALRPAPVILQSERRQPAGLPALQNLWDGSWMDKFERFAADRFPLREQWRTLRAFTLLKILRQTDKDGLFFTQGHAGKFEAMNETAIRQCAEKIAKLAAGFSTQQVYYAVIPDKSIYCDRKFPGYDPARMRTALAPALEGLKEIDLTQALQLDSYYRTDLHWEQSKLKPVLRALSEAMGFALLGSFTARQAGDFYGVYTGQLALPMPPDQMAYLTSDAIDRMSARYLDPKSGDLIPGPIYDLQKFRGRDPYDLFLRGAQPLILLENLDATTTRELILFRDSFGSSLAPLLLCAYRRITVIDLRYIHAQLLAQYCDFDANADVLFLYSSQIIQHADILKV